MKKYKKWWITLGVLLVLCLIGYIYWFTFPKYTANKAVDNYLAEQQIKSNQIETREIQKDWKKGGYLTKIVFKDDPKLKYEYSYDERYEYPYHIYVVAFKNGSSQENNQMKHLPLPEQEEE
ncbi:DUF3139 domain-containing protein [Listeria innocua]|uniref:DUF3139 domain-containing protein n=1 Tax=Listeria innocua TaxID=1642 RepID=UPI00162A9BA3|nr:DUF3139 domain-containing protein [Listeria innocua]MBC1353857.1 DUF3139 domain-containing protein [Listeria innocua]MBC1385597.1 DUF3139 domain-containing protein [Listeria innocua]MBC2237870.1 DUF3139 domain-containing protein [Listeria innocua]